MQNHTALLPRLDQHMTKLHTVADTCRYKLHHTAEHCNPAFGVCFTHRQHTHGRRRMCQPHRRATAELSQRTQLLTCPHRTQQHTAAKARIHTEASPHRTISTKDAGTHSHHMAPSLFRLCSDLCTMAAQLTASHLGYQALHTDCLDNTHTERSGPTTQETSAATQNTSQYTLCHAVTCCCPWPVGIADT